ncbi:MAG: TetR family transcriptional regulator [Acidobacteriota bacterium]
MNRTDTRSEIQTEPPRTKRRTGAHKPRKPESGGSQAAQTRESILDTAERLFAERGVAATSVRDITGAAGANLGAINYHFGTKQELVMAVFSRRIFPVAERQMALLDEAERKAGGKPPRLETLLEAMTRPSIEKSFAAGKRNTAFMRLVGRCYGEPNPEVERRIRAHVEKVWMRFAILLARSLPGLPHEEMYWRIRFMVGALHHTLLTSGREGSIPPEFRKGLDAETLIRRMVAYAAAGLKAGI